MFRLAGGRADVKPASNTVAPAFEGPVGGAGPTTRVSPAGSRSRTLPAVRRARSLLRSEFQLHSGQRTRPRPLALAPVDSRAALACSAVKYGKPPSPN